MKNFLIIQTAFLGDVILATPIISELHRLYPNCKIDVVVRKGNETLLANNPKIHHLFIWNKQKSKYKNLFRLIRSIRQKKYDEVITLQRYANAGLMTYFAKSASKIGFDKNAFSWIYTKLISHSLLDGTHEVERNLKLISHHQAEKLIRPELFPSAEDEKKIEKYCSSIFYCLAPASVWKTKQLPYEKWVNLIRILQEKGTVYLIGGPSDFDLCEKIKNNFGEKVLNLSGKLSLLQSAALMQKAKMNYVNDSGPLHIASAMNAPTRAFFCSTTPKFGFGPLADNSKTIEANRKLDCKPCTFHGRKKCPLKHYNCGNEIEITQKTICSTS